jgi:Calx-beta domain/Bacterial Ig-like domain (group 1)
MARWAPVRCCGSAFPRMGSPQGGRARRSVDTVGRAARLAALVALLSLFIGVANATATNGRVLILDSMVTGGAASPEAQAATAAGKGVDVVDDAIWSTMTTAQFAEYDALILGDPTCGSVSPAAEASALVWGAAVNGNVIIIGTDPVFHLFQGGGTLTNSGVAFAASDPGKTGAYITLSCQYHDTTPLTPVPLLAAFGTFTVTGVGCFNDAHIVATHAALAGLTDADLSNWSCSVHEAFDTIATGFLPLVIARGEHPGAIDFPDGSRGTPYIIARGVRLITTIELAPDSATNSVGSGHTVTATVKENGVPIVGTTVTFTVVSGPHAGTTGTAVTDGSGTAQFTYTGTAAGTDTIEASYVDSAGTTRKSNQVAKTWTMGPAASIDDVSVLEGNSGTANAVFTVSLDSASATPVTVDFATADGTATTPSDYASASGTLTFAPGETTKTVSVSVNGDLLVEPDESFLVNLLNAVGATIADGQGDGTIVNDDQPPAADDDEDDDDDEVDDDDEDDDDGDR